MGTRPLWATFGLTALLVPTARPGDGVDAPMYHDPELPVPRVVRKLPDRLPGLWVEALGRPEADMKRRAAEAIAMAHEQGRPGMIAAAPALVRELDRADQPVAVRLAVARTVAILDVRDAAPALARAADPELAEIADPALARWDYKPARAGWLARINGSPNRRGTVLAIRSLGVVGERGAVPRLRELALDRRAPAATRLEAARALAALRPAGGEADARGLMGDPSPRAITDRLVAASILRRHQGEDAVRELGALARDPEPAVAAVALARLLELNPDHVLALLDPVLTSADANIRRVGIEALALRPTAERVRLLGDLLSDPHPALRARARTALEGLAAKGEWKDVVIREGLRVLAGNDWRGLEQAVLLLGHLNHKAAAGRLVGLLRHDRPEVFVTAAWGLRVLGVAETLPAALAYYEAEYKAMFPPDRPGGRPAADVDLQLSQLGQFFGRARYLPADGLLRRLAPQATPTANPAGPEARAAAVWALGILHAGKSPPDLVTLLVDRLTAVRPLDVEAFQVRRMAAVALGRMKAADALGPLREFATGMKLSLDPVNNACCWAIEQITGEKVPPAVLEIVARDWFLSPTD